MRSTVRTHDEVDERDSGRMTTEQTSNMRKKPSQRRPRMFHRDSDHRRKRSDSDDLKGTKEHD